MPQNSARGALRGIQLGFGNLAVVMSLKRLKRLISRHDRLDGLTPPPPASSSQNILDKRQHTIKQETSET